VSAREEQEEALVPFAFPRDQVPLVTHFRSAWLHSSLRSLRTQGLFDRYLAFLPPRLHEMVLGSGIGLWLPGEIAVAHYAACEQLNLDASLQIAIGAEVAQRVHGTILSIAVKLVQEAGATPWTVLGQFGKLWGYIWQGGAAGVFKLGPKEARLEVLGWPCAKFTYCRNGILGVTQGLIQLFCRKVYVRDVPKLCTATTLGYRIAWA
jgi:hypothetical protein